MMWNHWGWGGDWAMGWGVFGLMHVLWWVLLIVLAVVLWRAVRRGSGGRDTAMDILRERYARGEIDQAEFAERTRQLKT